MVPVVGVIEGFYGRPWSWAERERMAEFMAARGFNFLAHAPKNEPLLRDRWREPHLPEELARFRRFNRRCERLGIELSVGLSPLRFEFAGSADFDRLWDKMARFAAAGVRSFGIHVDDMPPASRPGRIELVNRVWERLREIGAERLTFTPAEYCGPGTSAYLRSLGLGLAPAIDVYWTGPEVCSHELTEAHVRVLAETLRRPPLLWDNYPVNDLEMRNDPHLHPLRGREPRLWEAARGLVWAAGVGAELPKVALATCAAFAEDLAAYDPDSAWAGALAAVAGDQEDAEALAVLAGASWRSALERRPHPPNPFSLAAARFWLAWEAGDPEALPEMRAQVSRLRLAGERLQRARNSALRREIRPWADKLVAWAEVAQLALALLETADPALRRVTLDRIERCRASFAFVLGDQVEVFARRCLAPAPPEAVAAS